MQVLHDMKEFREEGCVLAMGTFDGVHRGHKTLLTRAVDISRKCGMPSAVLTFDRHPLALLCPERQPPMLTTPQQKMKLIEYLDIDFVIEQPFVKSYAMLTPEQFIKRVCRYLRPRYIVVGRNFTFGTGASGSAATLTEFGPQMGFEVNVVPPIMWSGEVVSSTRIRNLILAGYERDAELMAGHALYPDWKPSRKGSTKN